MYRQLTPAMYSDMVRNVRSTGCASKRQLFRQFGAVVGYSGIIQAIDRMKAEGIIADNGCGWLSEVKKP